MSDIQSSSSDPRYDHVARVRQLVWSLKDALANMLKIAAQNISYNSNVDCGVIQKQQKVSEEDGPRLDKAMEDVYAIFNQIELHLRTIYECTVQDHQSKRYLPFIIKDSEPETAVTYTQYIQTIKRHIALVDNMEKLFLEEARKMVSGEHGVHFPMQGL